MRSLHLIHTPSHSLQYCDDSWGIHHLGCVIKMCFCSYLGFFYTEFTKNLCSLIFLCQLLAFISQNDILSIFFLLFVSQSRIMVLIFIILISFKSLFCVFFLGCSFPVFYFLPNLALFQILRLHILYLSCLDLWVQVNESWLIGWWKNLENISAWGKHCLEI